MPLNTDPYLLYHEMVISQYPTSGKVVRRRLSLALPQLLLVTGSFLTIVALVGLTLGQRFFTTNQDIRSQATNPSGAVEVTLTAQPTSVTVGQSLVFSGTINTHSIQTDGIQLVLLLPKASVNTPTMELRSDIGLQQVLNRVVDRGDVYELQFIAIPATFGQAFSTTQAQPFLAINTTAQQAGNYSLGIDQSRSMSTRHGSNPVVDELKPITAVNFSINTPAVPPPNSTPTPTFTPASTPTPTEPITCDLTVPLAVPPAVTWIGSNQIKLQWQDAPTATGYRIYLINDGAAVVGQPYVIWNVLENNAAVSEDNRFSPVETDLIKESIHPQPNTAGAVEYTWNIPKESVPDRTGTPITARPYYRFLVYAFKGNDTCHKQAAIGRVVPPVVSTAATVQMAFSLQGLTKPQVVIPVTVFVQEYDPLLERPTPGRIYRWETQFTSDQKGTLRLLKPLQLSGLPVSTSGQYFDIFIKTPTSLRKKLGNMLLTPGANSTPNAWESQTALVGDFVQIPEIQWNSLNLLDVSAILAKYTRLQTPVTANNQIFDVTYDGKIDIMDVALVLSNYSQITVRGD